MAVYQILRVDRFAEYWQTLGARDRSHATRAVVDSNHPFHQFSFRLECCSSKLDAANFDSQGCTVELNIPSSALGACSSEVEIASSQVKVCRFELDVSILEVEASSLEVKICSLELNLSRSEVGVSSSELDASGSELQDWGLEV